ncbi:hypothetical protein Tco_0742029 [Tanacetum coccineum]
MNSSTIVSRIYLTNSNRLRRLFQLLKKAIERLKQGESINVQDLETNLYWEFGKFTSCLPSSKPSYSLHSHSSTKSQQAATRNRGKAIVNSSKPTYDQEPTMVAKDDEMSKDKEIDKLMALISLSFKKIYKPTNKNLEPHQTLVEKIRIILQGLTKLNAEQAGWRDDTDDEPEDQELGAHYIYMAQIQEVTPDAADNSGPIFDA